jgi:hypothetical protein
MRLHWLRSGSSQPLAGPHGLLRWAYLRAVALGAPEFLLIAGKAFTIWSNLMTVFGVGVNAPARVSATDPTFLMGANGSDPAKIAISAPGRTLLTATTAETQRAAAVAKAEMFTEYSVTEPFLAGSTSSASGGTTASQVVDGRVGVLRLSSSTAATTNARAAIGHGSADNCIDITTLPQKVVIVAAPSVSAFDGTNTGRLMVGYQDTDGTGLPGDAVWFRSDNGGNWSCETRRSNASTVTATSVTAGVGEWRTFAFRVTTTLAEFWIDGVLVATHTTNIPGGSGVFTGLMIRAQKTAAHTVNGSIDVDTMRLVITAPAAPI